MNRSKEIRKLIETVEHMNEDVDGADRLEEIKEEIKDLINEAYRIVRSAGDEVMETRAKRYWYGHIISSLDDEHQFLGNHSVTMQDTINEMNQSPDAERMEAAVKEVNFRANEEGQPLNQVIRSVADEYEVDENELSKAVAEATNG